MVLLGLVLLALGACTIESSGPYFYLAAGSFLVGCLLLYLEGRRYGE